MFSAAAPPADVCLFVCSCRWTVVTEMSASRSAAGVTVFDGRIFVSGGHDGLQIFNTVSLLRGGARPCFWSRFVMCLDKISVFFMPCTPPVL